MKILNKEHLLDIKTIGRFSDGSDSKTIRIDTWNVSVEDDNAKYLLEFDHEPSNTEITSAYNKKVTQFLSNMNYDELLQYKIDKIKTQCKDIIENGFNSDLKYGVSHRYTLKQLTDQTEIKSLAFNIISLGAKQVPWHYDKQILCDIWTSDEFMQFYKLANDFIINKRYKSDALELYITENKLSIEQLQNIDMNSTLPDKYQNMLKDRLLQIGVQLWND